MKPIQEGPRGARIVIVGEAPGANEQREGRPFVGGSGQLLDIMLSRAGILRSECFITNVVHMQPPGNEFAWFLKKENQAFLLAGMLQLKRDLEEIKPNLVIAMGAQALKVLTGKVGIEKYRGSILPCQIVSGLKVIATYHPAYVLRVYDYKAVVELDLRRCREDSRFPELRHPQRDLHLNPPPAERHALVEEMLQARWLGVDIECFERSTGGWSLACVGFSDRPDRALVIPADSASARADIARLCGHPVEKVLQNGTFDATVLASEGIELLGYGQRDVATGRVLGWDTMLAQHALYPECASSADEVSSLTSGHKRQSAIQKGLAFLVSTNTREPFYKDDGKLWRATDDLQMFWRYNALDAACTREIRDVQAEDIKAFGVERVLQHEMSLVRPLMAATDRGIAVDLEERRRMRMEVELEMARLQNLLDGLSGWHVNVKSNPDMKQLLYTQLKLPTKTKRGTDTVTADKDAILELAEKYQHPVLLNILAIRQRRDVVERYLDAKLDADGRMRCSFDITGTRTGRLSSRASIYGSGTNLQNQPERLRKMYVASPGKVLVARDYKQAEAWIVAYEARSERLIALLNDPSRDIHRENAHAIFGVPLMAVTYEMRQLAKKGGHGANYGVEAFRLMQVINQEARDSWGRPGTGVTATEHVARKVLDGYHMLYPEIKENYWAEVGEQLRVSRTLVTCLGRKRIFFGRWDNDKFLKEALAYKPQGTVGDLCCMALVAAHERFASELPCAQVLLNVHDSLVIETDLGTEEQAAEILADAMCIPLTIKGRTFTIPTDCAVGYNWGKRGKDGSNPHGLHDIDSWLAERPLVGA